MEEHLPPRLREGVSVERVGAAARVTDAASGFRLEVDGGVARLLEALDGRRAPADLCAALAAEGVAVAAGDVERVLALLDSMFLLDNERGRARAAAARARAAGRAAAPAPLQVLPEARFDCHACGYCCSNGQNFGPLTEEDRAKILAHDWAGVIPGVRGPQDLFYANEEGKVYLRQRQGRCVFLSDENLCTIHKLHGAETKPGVCRLFPYTVARTPGGSFVSTRYECKSLARSRATGTPVAAQVREIEVVADVDPDHAIAVGALVHFTGQVMAPWEVAEALRRRALAVLGAPDLDLAHGAVRDLVLGTYRRLGDHPGEAEFEAAEAFAAAPPPPPPAPIAAEAQAQSCDALAAMLAEMLDGAMKNFFYLRSENDVGATRLDMQEEAILVCSTLLARLGRPGLPPFDTDAIAAVRLDPEAEAIFRDAAREDVHGWVVASCQAIVPGYALLALRFLFGKWAARRRAARNEAPLAGAADAHEGLLLATRALAAPVNHRAAMRDLRRLVAFYRGLDFSRI